MTIEQLREAYNAEPFKPLVMHLADGRAVTVHHREFTASSPRGRTVTVYQPDGSMNLIDLLLATDLKVQESTKPGNGRRKRSR